jgi:hypothetical protein
MREDDEPELAGYVPRESADDEKPLRSPHLMTVMRVVVVLGIIGLVMPGILVTAITANGTAERSCAAYAAFYAPDAAAVVSRFDLFSAAGTGWNCYAVTFDGAEVLLATLGIIPGQPRLPNGPIERS